MQPVNSLLPPTLAQKQFVSKIQAKKKTAVEWCGRTTTLIPVLRVLRVLKVNEPWSQLKGQHPPSLPPCSFPGGTAPSLAVPSRVGLHTHLQQAHTSLCHRTHVVGWAVFLSVVSEQRSLCLAVLASDLSPSSWAFVLMDGTSGVYANFASVDPLSWLAWRSQSPP